MAEFRLERFKYTWKGDWTTGTAYKRDDVVRINGKSYVCILGHVSNTTFKEDLTATLPGSNPPQPQPRWVVMTSGRSFEGNWTTGTEYNLGDIVLYQGSLLTCTVSHLSSDVVTDYSYWEYFAQNTSFNGNWTSGTSYIPGTVVKYNGNLYKCVREHISESRLLPEPDDSTLLWELYLEGVEFRNEYVQGATYRINDIVKYGGTIYRCIEEHFSGGSIDDTKFTIESFGSQYEGDWNLGTVYNIGDLVNHRGFVYYAINNNTGSKPFVEIDEASPDWILLSRSYNFIGDWSVDSEYKTGDIVQRGGYLYIALRDISNVETVDNSTLDYLDDSTWEVLIPGKDWKGNWTSGDFYELNDVVYWKGSSYTCNFAHEASIENFPGDNGNVYNFWDLLIQSGQEGGLREQGDLLSYGLSREISYLDSTVFDDSTQGDVRVKIGQDDEILSVTRDLEVYWREIAQDAEVIYVGINGIDDNNTGTYETPFRTIRYATEYVEDNFTPGEPVIIRVSTGKFEEIGPIIIPAGCAINGDELRSTTVLANSPIPEYANDVGVHYDALSYFRTWMFALIDGQTVEPLQGNTIAQVDRENFDSLNYFDPTTGQPGFPASSIDAVNLIGTFLDTYQNYISFRVLDGENDPTLVGSNILTTNTNFFNASLILEANKDFIANQLALYIIQENPNITFNRLRIINDFRSLIRGMIRDCKYDTSNYGTITAARRYSNAVTGSQRDNLFFMRDSTGLRDMTTGGLQGNLNPPGVFELYQKPTGGACTSLDPGWGPDDERVWITNRSPYIQGVTNTGTGCVGKRVDGSLHNGGNKSMVSNDFTQVLSDGVGVWVSDNGRTELVSVFTYYCQIGYFAEDGGIIRATNGNNSYGRYGAIADGIDETETPQLATIFNRNNEANVIEAFAGGTTDQIMLFQYGNAGEKYTQASATITGSGSNASVEFRDFRDGGLFQARLTSPDGSSDEGGSGYTLRQGSAQETLDASSSLIISQNDPTQQLSEILGMRVIITEGTGVGQYGYVSDFNFVTRTITVRKESDDTLGWDHIISGTPSVTSFDLTTRYRVEPRLAVSAPAFDSSNIYDGFINRQYVDMDFGGQTETYNGLSGGSDIIWKDDNDNFITVRSIISSVAFQLNAYFDETPTVPFTIIGRTSGTEISITSITANDRITSTIEVDASGSVPSLQVGEEFDLILTSGSGDTFDGAPVPAEFNITRTGDTYNVELSSAGSGYKAGDEIVILGNLLGGTSPDNDATITVNSVSDDSTNSILTFTTSGTARRGRLVALTSSQYARYSDDGVSWVERELPYQAAEWKTIVAGNNRYLAIGGGPNGDSRYLTSLTGRDWSESAFPTTEDWSDCVWSGSKFVVIAENNDTVLSSSDGENWTQSSIPDDTDGAPDSTTSSWGSIAYGAGKFVAVSTTDRATATSTDGVTWTRHDTVLPAAFNLPGGLARNHISITFGDNKFVAVTSHGITSHSFDGITWYEGIDLKLIVTDFLTFPQSLKYDNGVFVLTGDLNGTATDKFFTSDDALIWTERTFAQTGQWPAVAYGYTDDEFKWSALRSAASTGSITNFKVGKRALLRAEVVTGTFRSIQIWDPGSAYTNDNLPVITVTDPNVITEIAYQSRIGDGVLAQPDFVNRGSGYRKSTSSISITGNGYADNIPQASELVIAGIRNIPSPGVQIQIAGVLDPDTPLPDDLYVFSGVEVFDLGDDGSGNETRLVKFTMSPSLEVELNLEHGTEVSLRERFSQCRISGHDFLDIGTGNFEETNYPSIYSTGNYFVASPENEVYETNSGRVFYVSTDQDGNFRTGELFSVQQATGIVTISAQFFDLDGLSQLALGGVRLGGSGAVVNEFSTDTTFSADSNNVVPTQRAIATFLSERLSVGGESLEVNALQAGRVYVGGADNEINHVLDEYLEIPAPVTIQGSYEATANGITSTKQSAISGTIVSQMLFFKENDENMD